MNWIALVLGIVLLNTMVLCVVLYFQRERARGAHRHAVRDTERPAHYVKLTASERKHARERNAARRARRKARIAAEV